MASLPETRHSGTLPSSPVVTPLSVPVSADLVRVSKLLADRGMCSRREADDWISRGWVLVDGQPAVIGMKAFAGQAITLLPEAVREQESLVTILLNKPIGYVSGQPEPGKEPAVALITAETRFADPGGPPLRPGHLRGLAPAGRLDIDSTGLLVFTQDGRMARKLTGDQGLIEKEYLVRVRGQTGRDELARLRHGLELDGQPLRPARVEWINADQLRIVLNEGRKRQIRRMCDAIGLQVVGLKRVRIGRIMLGKLPEGQWRFLRPGEEF
jgi:23S rRNA pseudouridine2604 synthase